MSNSQTFSPMGGSVHQSLKPLKEVNQALICFVLIVSDKGLSFQHEWTDEDQKLQLPGAQSGEAQPPQACGPRQCSEVLPGQHDGPGIHQEDGRYPLLIPAHREPRVVARSHQE